MPVGAQGWLAVVLKGSCSVILGPEDIARQMLTDLRQTCEVRGTNLWRVPAAHSHSSPNSSCSQLSDVKTPLCSQTIEGRKELCFRGL